MDITAYEQQFYPMTLGMTKHLLRCKIDNAMAYGDIDAPKLLAIPTAKRLEMISDELMQKFVDAYGELYHHVDGYTMIDRATLEARQMDIVRATALELQDLIQ